MDQESILLQLEPSWPPPYPSHQPADCLCLGTKPVSWLVGRVEGGILPGFQGWKLLRPGAEAFPNHYLLSTPGAPARSEQNEGHSPSMETTPEIWDGFSHGRMPQVCALLQVNRRLTPVGAGGRKWMEGVRRAILLASVSPTGQRVPVADAAFQQLPTTSLQPSPFNRGRAWTVNHWAPPRVGVTQGTALWHPQMKILPAYLSSQGTDCTCSIPQPLLPGLRISQQFFALKMRSCPWPKANKCKALQESYCYLQRSFNWIQYGEDTEADKRDASGGEENDLTERKREASGNPVCKTVIFGLGKSLVDFWVRVLAEVCSCEGNLPPTLLELRMVSKVLTP